MPVSPAATDLYDLESVRLPRLSGLPLRLLVHLVESPLRGLLLPSLLKNAGITGFREQAIDEPPTLFPLHPSPTPAAADERLAVAAWPPPPDSDPASPFATIHDYAQAYRDGTSTPEQVAQRLLAVLETCDRDDPPLCALLAWQAEDLREQARTSTERIRRGQARSPLEGVPVAVKDEVDMVPYPTTVGTRFMGTRPATQDATVVARLRAAGALLTGKAHMTEMGQGVTGLNPHHGTPRNPYAPACYTGGSSSGPAAAVAAGLCPVALGADGGGSIRVPAAFCGLVGLNTTFGRVSGHGAAPITWSLVQLGALAGSARDAALAYAALAGPDPEDPLTLRQPAPSLAGWDNLDLRDLTLGVYGPWFRHAEPAVVAGCEAMLGRLEGLGARVRETAVPDLEGGRVAHNITIGSDVSQALAHTYARHRGELGLDLRLLLALVRQFAGRDYVQAQRMRTRLMAHFQRALEEVDVIVTPSTALVAPPIPADALPHGDSDLALLLEILRFATPANLTGLPAISFPAGYTDQGLPIGLQAIGRPWQEATLLRLARAAEDVLPRRAPPGYYRLLET